MTPPTLLSLFSGVGGLDLGLERAGWSCVGQVEIDPFCRRVLERHWPDVPRWGDIREVDPDDLPRADLVCAGFPCQPVSTAGKRLGQEDERWLWPETARLVRQLRPRWVLLENVPGLLARGMGDVLGDLAACGYDAEWDCIPASALGAPHRRDRVWVVAYPGPQAGRGQCAGWGQQFTDRGAQAGDAADPERQQLRDESGRRDGQGRAGAAIAGDDGPPWALADAEGRRGQLWATSAERPWGLTGSGHDFGGHWATESDVGRVAHGVPARLDRLGSLGNAVVPQIAELIGRRILDAHLGREAAVAPGP